MRPHFFRFIFLLVVLFGGLLTQAQSNLQSSAPTAAIQDNSFLIEEAYNQEDGVIQHISTFERLTNSRDWVYSQTDEWPVRTYKHQVSVTLAARMREALPDRARAGEIRLSTIVISWSEVEKRGSQWLRD